MFQKSLDLSGVAVAGDILFSKLEFVTSISAFHMQFFSLNKNKW